MSPVKHKLPEAAIQRQIIDHIHNIGGKVIRCNSGVATYQNSDFVNARQVAFNHTEDFPKILDLVGYLKDGRFFAFEVKTVEKARQVKFNCGRYVVATHNTKRGITAYKTDIATNMQIRTVNLMLQDGALAGIGDYDDFLLFLKRIKKDV